MTKNNGFLERVLSRYDDLSEDQLKVALYEVTAMYAYDKAKILPPSERKDRNEEEFVIVLGEIIASTAVTRVIKLTAEYEEHNKEAEKQA